MPGPGASDEAKLDAPRPSTPGVRRVFRRLRQRKGAITVLVGAMFVMLMGFAAMAIDFSRLWSLRNELETSADAAALAGAVQLVPPNDTSFARDSARAYALLNTAMGGTVTVDSIELGSWDDPTSTFTELAVGPYDATRVVVSRASSGLIMSFFGVLAPRIKARAVAWSDAPVTTTTCMKPWAIPYPALMSVINTHRGIVNNTATLTRAFDNVADMQALRDMTNGERTFRLILGDGNISEVAPDPATMPNQYQPLALPVWKRIDESYSFHSPSPIISTNDYENNVAGETCFGLTVGDSLVTMADGGSGIPLSSLEDATIQGAGPTGNPGGICTLLPASGQCVNSGGSQGVDIKAVFYSCASGCTGTALGIKLLGSFTLSWVFQSPGAPPVGVPGGPVVRAEIAGVFKPIIDNGPVGGAGSTLRRTILVR
jgi:Flp pilus assembly protein TadG